MAIRAALLAVGLSAPAGCKDKAKEISTPEYLLARQHQIWDAARESLRSDQPNLNLLRSAHRFLCYRTPRRVAKAYAGADKAEVLAKLRAVGEDYRARVYSKLDLSGGEPRLARGVTLAQLREAFDEVDKAYREVQAMTAPK